MCISLLNTLLSDEKAVAVESFNTEGIFSQRSVHSLPVPSSVFAFKEKHSTYPFLGTRTHSRVPFSFFLLLPARASQSGNCSYMIRWGFQNQPSWGHPGGTPNRLQRTSATSPSSPLFSQEAGAYARLEFPAEGLQCVIKPGEGVVGRSPFVLYIQFPHKRPWGSFGKKITSLGWLEVTQHIRRGWHLISLRPSSPVPRLILQGRQPESR